MLKVVLPLLFAAFALTTALPVRNRLFEDVDDYNRDFVPKKSSDFYETAYDEYLRRRQPALSESPLEDYEEYPSVTKRVFDEFYYRDEPEKKEFSDDELLSRAFLPKEDDMAFDKSDEDYPLEDPAPWSPMEENIVGVNEYFPKYSNDEDVDEWLSDEQIPWANDDEQEDDEEETLDAPEEKVDDEFDLDEDSDMAEEEPNDAEEDESDEEFQEDEPVNVDVNVEKAEDAVDEAKEAIVKDESKEDESEEVADEKHEGKEADEPEKEESQEEDEDEEMLQDEDETEEDDAAQEDKEEDEVDDMLQAQDETEDDYASEEDKEADEAEEDDEADDMLENNEIEDAANELSTKEENDEKDEDETEKDAGELWKENLDEDDAEVRASLPRYRDFPSERKMVEDHNKLERELEYFENHGFPSDDETYDFDK